MNVRCMKIHKIMSLIDQLDKERIPEHIAIIMDGNGRWAKKKGNIRIFGHQNGIKAVRETVEGAAELGIKYLTLYAFSTENWNRPKMEIQALMSLMVSTINNETKTLIDNNVRLLAIGDLNALPDDVFNTLHECMEITSGNTGLNLVLALSYSARWEITQALKNIVSGIENKDIKAEDINCNMVTQYLSTAHIPDPELLIRTSGEQRLSNFMLWQLAYTELYFTNVLWPDFRKTNLIEAIKSYQQRERRFGKISEQIKAT